MNTYPGFSCRASRRLGRGAVIRRDPLRLSSAGTSVCAAVTANTTAPPAQRPMTVRNGIWTMASATIATNTVIPATQTAVPAVPPAKAAASAGAFPSMSSCR